MNNNWGRIRGLAFTLPVLSFLLLMMAVPAAFGQSKAEEATPAPKFEVLDVTTGSGSKSQPANKAEVKIETIPATPAVVPQTAAAPDPGSASASPALEVPLPPNMQAGADDPQDSESDHEAAEGSETEQNQAQLIAALNQWHERTLENYNYNVIKLADPFMPIKEVRGIPPEEEVIDLAYEATLPPILRLELNQLKLVAITVLSDRPGGALASFEDGAGSSYILRENDRIGRRKGVITKINPTTVIVNEPAKNQGQPPTITEIKLNVLSTDGMTRNPAPTQ